MFSLLYTDGMIIPIDSYVKIWDFGARWLKHRPDKWIEMKMLRIKDGNFCEPIWVQPQPQKRRFHYAEIGPPPERLGMVKLEKHHGQDIVSDGGNFGRNHKW